jgi:hypothetical protein
MHKKPHGFIKVLLLVLTILFSDLLPLIPVNAANGWSTRVPVSGTDGTSYTPQLAVDSRGTVHMIWLDWVDLNPHQPYILYANKPAGGNWTSFEYLPGHPTLGESAISVGPDDTVHIVWSAAGDGSIQYISRTVGGTWSSIQEVSSGMEGNEYPDIAVAPNGTVHVVWNYSNVFHPNQQGIYHAMKPQGGSWSTPTQVYKDQYTLHCLIETDIHNTAHLIMDRDEDSNVDVYYAYKLYDEDWSSPSKFAFAPALQGVEQLASDGQTNLILVWRERDVSDCSLKYISGSTTDKGGGWLGPYTAVSGDCSDVYIEYPSVTYDHQGNPIAVWSSRFWDDDDQEFKYSIWFASGGGAWSGAALISSDMTYANASSVAVDGTGGRHVVWDTGPAPAYPGEIFYAYKEEPPEPPVTAVITPSGGSLQSPSGDVKVTFPPGSVTENVEVTFTRVSSTPTGNLAGIIFFDLSAETVGDGTPVTTFDPPYEITIDYGIEGSGAVLEETMKLYYWDGTQWQLEPTSSLDLENQLVTATLNHMTLFALLGETAQLYLPLVLH